MTALAGHPLVGYNIPTFVQKSVRNSAKAMSESVGVRMSKRNCSWLILLFLLSAFQWLWAQMPSHTRLLFEDNLQSGGAKEFGEITNNNGTFVAGQGWQAKARDSQLRIDLKDYLPFEATMEVTIKGLLPTVDDDWVPISIWSRPSGDFYNVDPSAGSYAFIKTQANQVSGNSGYWHFFSCPYYGGYPAENNRAKTYPVADQTWNPDVNYNWKIVWGYDKNQSKMRIWLLLNDVEKASHDFINVKHNKGQIENFAHIFLGTDNTYSSMAGPIYKDLKVWVPESTIKFANTTKSSGVAADTTYGKQGVSWADVNGDDLEDLYVAYANTDRPKQNMFFRQAGDGTFVEESALRGMTGNSSSFSSVFADFDKDGDLDYFQGNYNAPNRLYLNDGSGTFQDRSSERGISSQNRITATVLALDVENDGDLDIYAANIKPDASTAAPHELYLNQGNGTFTRIDRGTDSPQGTGIRAVAADVNMDGWVDIFYTRRDASCVLLINNQQGGFVDEAAIRGVGVSTKANSPTLTDYDNDGDLDLFITVASTPEVLDPKVLVYENDGAGVFTDRTASVNIGVDAYGVIAGDVDNDRFSDLYFVRNNGRVGDATSYLYRNSGSKSYALLSGTGAEAIYADGRGGAFADYNRDGRVDIYGVAKGGILGSKHYGRNQLLKNVSSNSNYYLPIAIIDENDLVDGLGAKIWVYQAGHLGQASSLLGYREIMPVQGYQSQESLVQHFGLGTNPAVDIQVVMPGGKTVTRTNVPAIQPGQPYQRYDIKPLAANPQTLELVKGAAQMTGTAGAPLADSIIVRVIDAENKPVSGHAVSFQMTAGGGKLNGGTTNPLSINTDPYGLARVSWTLGTVAGQNNNGLTVTAKKADGSDLTGSPMSFTASATSGNPAKLVYVSGSGQSGYVLQDLDNPLVVKVTDQYDNVIKTGHLVSFDVTVGGGTLAGGASGHADATTDTSGLAKITWRLGPQEGTQKVNASSSFNGSPLAGSPQEFTATANPPQLKIVRVSPRLNTGTVGETLTPALEVRVEDLFGSPASGKTVKFIVVSGGGKFSGKDTLVTTTGSDGKASATATLGTAAGDSNNVFHAKTEGAQGSPVDFKATALAGPAFKLQEISGNNKSGTVNRLLAEPFVVRVLDAYNNAISNYSSVGYQVTRGGGTINGMINASITTDPNGYASPTLRLGSKVDTNIVVASVNGLQGSPITFRAVASASVPAKLNEVSGNTQSGNAGQELPRPFVVSVTDSFANPIASHNVHFEVTDGGGNIGGSSSADVPTNPLGEASVTLTLGPTAYRNEVTVTSQYDGHDLEGSGLIFTATTGPGDPDSLVYVSGDHQIGKISAQLPEPFKVKVTDANGIPIPNHEVTFYVITGGGHFNGNNNVKTQTGPDGIAFATPTIGTNLGNDVNVFEARATFNEEWLKGSPITLYASGRITTARKMERVTPASISGTVGQTLIDTLKVRLLDKDGYAVADHPVTFTRLDGASLLADSSPGPKEVTSDPYGIAKVGVKLATTPGKSTFRASTSDGFETTFQGSPIDFEMTAVIGPPDANVSTIVALPDTLVVGGSAKITVTVKDAYGNAIPDKPVVLAMEGLPEATLTQPPSTGANGQAEGSIASEKAGVAKVWAMLDGQTMPADTVEIVFKAGAPDSVMTFGSGQAQQRGTLLEFPVGVIVKDNHQNPVINCNVIFTVKDGNGFILEPQPVATDSEGIASVHWQLGPNDGWQHLNAVVDGYAKSLSIEALAFPPPVGSIEKVSGDSLIGYFNQVLEPFVVMVKDTAGQAIPNLRVRFSLTSGEGVFTATNKDTMSVLTDAGGYASAQFRADNYAMPHQVFAIADDVKPAVFNFIIQRDRTIFLLHSQDRQSARPAESIALIVTAKDAYSRVLIGERIKFEVTKEGYGTIVPSTQPVRTSDLGEAKVTWILGWPDTLQTVRVTAVDAPGTTPVDIHAILDNKRPELVVPPPSNKTVEVGDTLRFKVSATDLENDLPIAFGARGLPFGANFDSLDTQEFFWTPRLNQVNQSFEILFLAADKWGAVDTAMVTIRVGKSNNKPQIYDWLPHDYLLLAKQDRLITFKVIAFDQDGDSLSFLWYLNNSLYAFKVTQNSYDSSEVQILFKANPPTINSVVAMVTDGKDTTNVTWDVRTSVTLSSFEAVSRKNAVELQWRTASESNNLGFNVLRSMNKNGPFRQINQTLIAPAPTASYSYVDKDVQAGMTYYYKLQDVERNGATTEHGPVSAQVALPTELALAQNYPNPFNPATTISFELPTPQNVRLVVYNIAGQEIRTLVNGSFAAGVHDIIWDARDNAGQALPTGVYYYRLYTAKEVLTKKLLLTK